MSENIFSSSVLTIGNNGSSEFLKGSLRSSNLDKSFIDDAFAVGNDSDPRYYVEGYDMPEYDNDREIEEWLREQALMESVAEYEAQTITVIISRSEKSCAATVNGVEVGWVNTWFNNTFAACYNFGFKNLRRLGMSTLDHENDAAHNFISIENAALWLGDMIARYFKRYGYTVTVINA